MEQTTRKPRRELSNRTEWLTVRESAETSGYHPEYIRQLARAGTVASHKIAATLLVSRSSLLSHQRDMTALGTKRFSKRLARKRKTTYRTIKNKAKQEQPLSVVATPKTESGAPRYLTDDAERRERNLAVVKFLDELAHATGKEAEEQRETFRFLVKALDEDRLSNRKLFPKMSKNPR